MAILFVDSSALVKRYIAEPGSQWITELMAPSAANVINISVVTGAEVISAFVRRQRGGSLTPEEASLAITEFSEDWHDLYDLVMADREVINRAMSVAQRYGLRGYDAVQLASAMEVGVFAQQLDASAILVSADEELNDAAAAEGLHVENPNLHP